MSRKTIKAECSSCGGSGVYQGFCEPPGTAVVCLGCRGTGCETISYIPFTVRRKKSRIRTVNLSRGGFLATGVEAVGESISYSDFFKGKMPGGKE
jgi:hypothetical protein